MLNRLPGNEDMAKADKKFRSLMPITVENLNYETRGQTLLDNLNFKIPSKTKTVIMGPNGAGKSLLLRILHGLIYPSRGIILWNGIPADVIIQAAQAMVFQRPVLLRRSALKNISYVLKHLPKPERQSKAQGILEKANLSEIAHTPAGLLSGGEQQRLAIARAMANEPKVLFLDEPSASLDPASTHSIEQMIENAYHKGTKTILVTHDIGQARRLADDIIFLHRGQLCETESAETFFSNPSSPAAKAYLIGELFLDHHETNMKGTR